MRSDHCRIGHGHVPKCTVLRPSLGKQCQQQQQQQQEEDSEEEAIQGEEQGTCPEGLQSVDGLPGCCVPEPNYLGDGACDPWAPYNTESCAFDLGDCCKDTCNKDSAYGCDTKEGGEYGPFGFFCIDTRSKYFGIDEAACQVENREWIGDGGCDADGGYNTPECNFDGGDCCEDTCDPEFSFYTCGANQPYSCVDPDAGKARSMPLPDYHEGFESGDFDPSFWSFVDTGDAQWEVENDSDAPAAEGSHFAEARTEDILDDFGEAVLEFRVSSPNGGKLSFQVQTHNRAPVEDLVLKIDSREVSVIVDTTSDWRLEEFDITKGEHVISWVHRKNPGNLPEDELVMMESSLGISRIDDVTFHPY
mmetsp:Transcript_2796/g.5539  ORF Transcript_2796/g.5539 Transcript_2796/m.5539 type:complete len:362 (-) Transcript_2796:64-1149(-)